MARVLSSNIEVPTSAAATAPAGGAAYAPESAVTQALRDLLGPDVRVLAVQPPCPESAEVERRPQRTKAA